MFATPPAKPGGNGPAAKAEVELGQARADRQLRSRIAAGIPERRHVMNWMNSIRDRSGNIEAKQQEWHALA